MRIFRLSNQLAFLTAAAAFMARGAESGYIDPAVCAECHPKAAASYAGSGMARSFGPARDIPSGAFVHDKTSQSFHIARRGGKMYLSRSVDGFPEVYEAEMMYRIGSGDHAASYLSKGVGGRLNELPLTWYRADGGHWGMSPGYDLSFHAGFARKITYGCVFCHAGYPNLQPGAAEEPSGWRMPDKMPEGIDCQRCHGPGGAHVNAAQTGQPAAGVRAAIVNPQKLDARRSMDVCLQCHLETTALRLPASIVRYDRRVFSYRAGEPLEDYVLHFDEKDTTQERPLEFAGEAYRLALSSCFRKSNGAMTCVTCHNPHDSARGVERTQKYNGVCQTCHSPVAGAHFAAGDCVSCHMPKRRPVDAVNTMVSDHWIRKRPAAEASGPLVERNDTTSAPYRGEVIFYDLPGQAHAAKDELYLADAQLKNGANTEAGIARMEAMLKQNASVSGEFYLDLAESTRSSEYARKATEAMPADWRALLKLGQIAGDTTALRRAAALAPDEPSALQALGEAYSRQGNFSDGLAAFRAAVTADPDFAEGHNNIGTALLRAGDLADAEKELREAVRLRPESSAMQTNLAALLGRSGQLAEARRRFDLALKLNPKYADAHAAYGAALAQVREWNGARLHFEQALALNPKLPVTHHNLGVVLVQTGDVNAAAAQFQAAVNIDPDYYEAHLELGLLLKRSGSGTEAKVHLRKAQESPAPRVQQAAAQALKD